MINKSLYSSYNSIYVIKGYSASVISFNYTLIQHDMMFYCQSDVDQREWARDIWNKWFDETFPPEQEKSDNDDEYVSFL